MKRAYVYSQTLIFMVLGIVLISCSSEHREKDTDVKIMTPVTIVNLRTGPGTNFGIVTGLHPGEILTVEDDSNEEWLSVATESGKKGYVASKYLRESSSLPHDSIQEISIGRLSLKIPSSMLKMEIKKTDFSASDHENLLMLVSSIPLDGNSASKISSKGDWLIYPLLKNAELMSTDKERWNDWVHDYEIHSYSYLDEDKDMKAYTYHIMAGGRYYIILFAPYTEKGDDMARKIMNEGITNNSWFSNGGIFWCGLYIILGIIMIFYGEYNFWSHIKKAFWWLIVFSGIALYFTGMNMDYFWSAFWIALAIVLLVPPLRTPIIYILEHAD